MDVFVAFKEHYLLGKPWHDTQFYKRVINEILSGKVKWGCISVNDFEQRLIQIEKLYNNMKNTGYKTQSELGTNTPWDEIKVCIARSGEVMLLDGRHRLAIARILNLKSIPIIVFVRHKEWYNFCQEIYKFIEKSGGKCYQPILHPDLKHIPYFHGENRFRIIKENLPIRNGRLLDIGANWGYFCHRFEDYGFDCVACESSEKNVYFMKKLRDAEDKKFKIYKCSIFDFPLENNKFDVVLALNIFHHFLKEKGTYYQLKSFLQKLKVRYMVVETHLPESPQMRGAYLNLSPKEFVSFILKNSCLNNANYIGHAEDGRPIFLLE